MPSALRSRRGAVLRSRRGAGAAGVSAAVFLMIAAGAQAQAPCSCPGDCDSDCVVSEAERRQAIRAIFDPAALAACTAADADGSGRVTAADLVRIALSIIQPPPGCGGVPTATPSPSPPPTPTRTPTRTRTPTPTATRFVTPASQWIDRAALPGGGRQEIGAALLDGRIYVMGGLGVDRRETAVVEAYDVASDDWSAVASLPTARHHIGAAAAGGHVYSIGGLRGGAFTPSADVFRYDAGGNEWAAVASLPTARGALAVVELDGLIYAIGGSGPGGSVDHHAVYDPGANNWTPLAPLPTARNHLAAAAIGDFIYAVGGRDAANIPALNRYDPARDEWETLAPLPTRRSGIGAAVWNGRLVVVGGEGAPCTLRPRMVCGDVEIYDPATDTWTAIDPMPEPRHGIWAVNAGGRIHVPGGATFGGFDATDHHDALVIE